MWCECSECDHCDCLCHELVTVHSLVSVKAQYHLGTLSSGDPEEAPKHGSEWLPVRFVRLPHQSRTDAAGWRPAILRLGDGQAPEIQETNPRRLVSMSLSRLDEKGIKVPDDSTSSCRTFCLPTCWCAALTVCGLWSRLTQHDESAAKLCPLSAFSA